MCGELVVAEVARTRSALLGACRRRSTDLRHQIPSEWGGQIQMVRLWGRAVLKGYLGVLW